MNRDDLERLRAALMLAEFEARQQRDEARKGGDETVTPRGAGAKLPPLPDEVVARTRAKYVEAYERITGSPFE